MCFPVNIVQIIEFFLLMVVRFASVVAISLIRVADHSEIEVFQNLTLKSQLFDNVFHCKVILRLHHQFTSDIKFNQKDCWESFTSSFVSSLHIF